MATSNLPDTKECSKCGERKPLDMFYGRAEAGKKGLRSQCKDCHRAYRKANTERHRERTASWYARNRDKVKVRTREYAAAHPEQTRELKRRYVASHPDQMCITVQRRRARKSAAPVNDLTAGQWREIKARYGYRCVYCGKKPKTLTQDHITPLSRGGSHTISNVVPACRNCNARKGTKTVLAPVQPLLLTVN